MLPLATSLQLRAPLLRYASTIPRRRRSLTTTESVGDQVGPPSPASNLRPVLYAPLFPTSSSALPASASNAAATHPYSLSEFPTSAQALPPHLQVLKSRLQAEDLQYLHHRRLVDSINEKFWASQATDFEKLEAEAAAGGKGEAEVDERKRMFYGKWLESRSEVYRRYCWEWWGLQWGLVKAGWKAERRRQKWGWECWKAGV